MATIQHRTTGRTFELDADTLVGSSSRCDLTLRHDSVSRNHASICWLAGAWHVKDRNSKNGTWVGGQRLGSAHYRLGLGDELRFGARGAEEWCVTNVSPPPQPSSDSATTTLPLTVNQAALSIRAEASLVLTLGTATHQLEWRAPYVTLQTLGAERLKDRQEGRSLDQEGWLDRRVLADLCERDINQDICRIRQAFNRLDLFVDADSIIEDQRECGKVRLGLYQVRLE